MTKLILFALALGMCCGYVFVPVEAKGTLDTVLLNALNVLIFIAGIEIGANKEMIKKLLKPQTIGLMLLIPCATIVGSFLGGSLMGWVVGLPWYEALIVSAGLGWYSLSSVVVTALYSTELGTVAFLANALREICTFLFVPLLVRFNKLGSVAVGGATTMDSTLPVLLKCGGMQLSLIGFIHGVLLTLLIPFLLNWLLT